MIFRFGALLQTDQSSGQDLSADSLFVKLTVPQTQPEKPKRRKPTSEKSSINSFEKGREDYSIFFFLAFLAYRPMQDLDPNNRNPALPHKHILLPYIIATNETEKGLRDG